MAGRFILYGACVILLSGSACNRRIVQREFDRAWENKRGVQPHFTGFALYDPIKGRSLYRHQADLLFTPASNVKILTLYTCLKVLGDSIPVLRYTQHGDTLQLQGCGSPLLFHPDFEQADSAGAFLRKHKARYIKVFKRPIADAPLGPGWAWDDYLEDYSCERSALPIHGNAAYFMKDDAGITVLPALFRDSMARSSTPLPYPASFVWRLPERNVFHYRDDLLSPGAESVVPLRMQEGITFQLLEALSGKPATGGSAVMPQFRTLRQSADSLYRLMMFSSDNLLAEQLLLTASGLRYDTLSGTRLIRWVMDTLWQQQKPAIRWVDGSGLSRYNLVSPSVLIAVLNEVYQTIPSGQLLRYFPAGGRDGTLRHVPKSDQGPFLYAKSGSMGNTYNLSGFLQTRRGRLLTFSLMHNHFTAPGAAVRRESAEFLLKLHNRL